MTLSLPFNFFFLSISSSFINSERGIIYEGQDSPDCPRIDESTVVFSVIGGIKAYRGSVEMIANTSWETYCPDVSGDLVVYGPKIYSFKNSTEWAHTSGDVVSLISGTWVVSTQRGNFGKSAVIDASEIRWNYWERLANLDVGSYGYLDSLDFDGNLAVWSYGGVAYVHNFATMETTSYYAPNGNIDEIAVGGGKLLWSATDDSGKYHVYMGNAPSTPTYVDIVLKNYEGSGTDMNFNTLLIEDSNGKRLGIGKDYKTYHEISGGVEMVTAGKTYWYRVAGAGELKYSVIGYSSGKYDLIIERHGAIRGSDLIGMVRATGISIEKGKIQKYVVDWDKLASGMNGAVRIYLDRNGDGTFESEISTNSGEIDQETIDSGGSSSGLPLLGNSIYLVLLGIAIIVIVILVALLARRKK